MTRSEDMEEIKKAPYNLRSTREPRCVEKDEKEEIKAMKMPCCVTEEDGRVARCKECNQVFHLSCVHECEGRHVRILE